MHHNRINPRDALQALDDRIKKLTDSHDRMRSETTHTVQIHSTLDDNEVQDPVEGEIRINGTTSKLGWRVNDAWHYPGGVDAPWAALYDDFIYGQWVGATADEGDNVRLVWPFGIRSDNSDGIFNLTQSFNTEYGIDEVKLELLVPGALAINISMEYSPSPAKQHVRHYVYSTGGGGDVFDYPGRVFNAGGPFNDFAFDVGWEASWDIWQTTTWVLPGTKGSNKELRFGFYAFRYSPGTNDSIISEKRVWVTYLGTKGPGDWTEGWP